MSPLAESDLIFPLASFALKDTVGDLKRRDLSIRNRLLSIHRDAQYIQSIAKAYGLPLVANERCGSWYIPPPDSAKSINGKQGSVYFKSTDGHFAQWSFSLRRLNLQILELVGEHAGCIVVDSTRKGKSMPDALSKTIPIWIAVINRLLFPEARESHLLCTPRDVVSGSEHAQIEAKLDTFLRNLQMLRLDLDDLKAKLRHRYISVCWHRPGDDVLTAGDKKKGPESNLLVLCTASNATSARNTASDYVQGAADDHESWALGLDASTFWAYSDRLLTASDDQIPDLITSLSREQRRGCNQIELPMQIKPCTSIWIGNNDAAREYMSGYDYILSCVAEPIKSIEDQFGKRYVTLSCPEGKVGSRHLRTELPKIFRLAADLRQRNDSGESRILISCQTGDDLAVGAALAFICRFYDGDGGIILEAAPEKRLINKAIIKQRLSWIMISSPYAKPSRATLQSVNAFLMENPHPCALADGTQ